MEMSYLGIFSWVFNKVMDHIFSPVFDFLASVISAGLGFIFENVLAPILLPILQMALDWYMKIVSFIMGVYYYQVLKFVLSVIDYLEKAFGIFIGLEQVTYYPNGPKGAVSIKGSLLEILINIKSIRNAFWLIMVSGIGIAVFLSIYGVARSAFDLDFENKRPVSHVLSQLFKSIVCSFLIPFMVMCMVTMATTVLNTVDRAVSLEDGEKSTLGSTLFVLSSVNAAWDSKYNMVQTKMQTTGNGLELEYVDKVNEKFDLMKAPRYKFYVNDTYDNYKNMISVGRYFMYGGFDFTYILIGIVLIIIMIMCLFNFIRRLFEILLLYLVSPYFVAIMPLDDGEKFKQWFGMFSGKLVTGYGSVVIMKIYLLLMPLFMRGGIQFTNMGRESTFILYGLFAIGGAWAVFKSGSMLTSLVNEAAGRHEQEAMQGAMGMMMMASSPLTNQLTQKMTKSLGGMFSKKGAPKTPHTGTYTAKIDLRRKQMGGPSRSRIAIGAHRSAAGRAKPQIGAHRIPKASSPPRIGSHRMQGGIAAGAGKSQWKAARPSGMPPKAKAAVWKSATPSGLQGGTARTWKSATPSGLSRGAAGMGKPAAPGQSAQGTGGTWKSAVPSGLQPKASGAWKPATPSGLPPKAKTVTWKSATPSGLPPKETVTWKSATPSGLPPKETATWKSATPSGLPPKQTATWKSATPSGLPPKETATWKSATPSGLSQGNAGTWKSAVPDNALPKAKGAEWKSATPTGTKGFKSKLSQKEPGSSQSKGDKT